MTDSTQGQPTRGGHLKEFAAGARDIIPMMVGAAPFGVIFGTLVTSSPLHLWHGQLMSLVVFAGSAQFIALGLIAGHASFAVIWATTLVVNLRHVLYSATLAPHVAHLPKRWRWALGALLTDEVFAVAWEHYRHREPGTVGPYYFCGAGVAMYLNWQLWTVAGLLFGSAFPGLQSLGLDFAMVATFIAIVVPQLVALRYIAAAVTAGTLAFFWQAWPYKLGLLGAVFAGVAVGVLLSMSRLNLRGARRPVEATR
ncbi:4-azaleucine resistance transporter AzlC [Paraburkholderia sp. CI2]|uniref:AzlC family ABC transporter permease n=1 Tax=Paraburkholderia sp. CI2 TaxID=2723093 RepID=UPI0016171629|nr:AzlC family ABC transporter permease [Paraburkholderia sp. CI2]MBB5470676.1 4-azaleucine resistance transporter AzlC [Paraburkholderia sp. CI2]